MQHMGKMTPSKPHTFPAMNVRMSAIRTFCDPFITVTPMCQQRELTTKN